MQTRRGEFLPASQVGGYLAFLFRQRKAAPTEKENPIQLNYQLSEVFCSLDNGAMSNAMSRYNGTMTWDFSW